MSGEGEGALKGECWHDWRAAAPVDSEDSTGRGEGPLFGNGSCILLLNSTEKHVRRSPRPQGRERSLLPSLPSHFDEFDQLTFSLPSLILAPTFLCCLGLLCLAPLESPT